MVLPSSSVRISLLIAKVNAAQAAGLRDWIGTEGVDRTKPGGPLGSARFAEVFKINPVDGMSLPCDEMETLTWEGLPTS